MGRYYSDSQIDVVGDFQNGLHVETSAYDLATYWDGAGGPTQLELFNIYGRCLILQLFCEIVVIQGGGATLVRFNATWSNPAAATIEPISAVSASVAGLAVGSRVVWQGGVITSIPILTVVANGGISDLFPVARQILGCVGGVGTIGHVPSVADTASGSARANCYYVPLSDDAYITAAF